MTSSSVPACSARRRRKNTTESAAAAAASLLLGAGSPPGRFRFRDSTISLIVFCSNRSVARSTAERRTSRIAGAEKLSSSKTVNNKRNCVVRSSSCGKSKRRRRRLVSVPLAQCCRRLADVWLCNLVTIIVAFSVVFAADFSHFAGTFDRLPAGDVLDASALVLVGQSPRIFVLFRRSAEFCPRPACAVRHVWSIDCAQFASGTRFVVTFPPSAV